MALVFCRECQKQVSDQAAACPHCGAPWPARTKWSGWGFEWRSQKTLYGWPLVHVAIGRNARGKLRVAKGVIAIGQFAIGLVTVAQFGVGILFGLGQFMFGLTALAQFAGAVVFGAGQIATGYVAVGQIVLAYYGFGQAGAGAYLWTQARQDPEAVRFFRELWEQVLKTAPLR